MRPRSPHFEIGVEFAFEILALPSHFTSLSFKNFVSKNLQLLGTVVSYKTLQ